MSYARLPRFVGETDPVTRIGRLVIPFVFGRSVNAGDDVCEYEYAAMFAYKALLDMHVESTQILMILRFFREQFIRWQRRANVPFILSLNDGYLAVVITAPECRRIYDYKEDVDRTHPTQAIPLPAPIVQASVNLSRVIELELQIR